MTWRCVPSGSSRGSQTGTCRRTACGRCSLGRDSITYMPLMRRGNSTPFRLKGRNALSSWWNAFEVVRIAHADRRAVVAVAPGHVVAVFQPGYRDRRRVRSAPGSHRRENLSRPTRSLAARSSNRRRPDLNPAMEVHDSRRVVHPEDAGVPTPNGTTAEVEDAVRAFDLVTLDDRIEARSPYDRPGLGRTILPRDVRESARDRRNRRRGAVSRHCWLVGGFHRGPFVYAFAGRPRAFTRHFGSPDITSLDLQEQAPNAAVCCTLRETGNMPHGYEGSIAGFVTDKGNASRMRIARRNRRRSG